ncbi:RHS repeat protein [Rhodanobacter sp. 7MK24]|uniref:RHS repeat-associated core domain-containing protein n=1 Tax=Rhodanobacter sp. 7MK24 TaxID=2775922 RepID=UPI00177C2600|nr:RHS repeat-associated core domain-containing protein [Rhodanobacter sp. 7MK24]MBD8882128.1 RHS repeat protein [Rhodanobacter sp. 7MK24]
MTRTKVRLGFLVGLFLCIAMHAASAMAQSGCIPTDWPTYSDAESTCQTSLAEFASTPHNANIPTSGCYVCCLSWNNPSHTVLIGAWVFNFYNQNIPDNSVHGYGNQWACQMPFTLPSAPGKANGAPTCGACVGDPINVGSGNVYRREEDFHNGRWLRFDRYYNSDPSAAADTFGPHWRHSYSSRIDGGTTGTSVVTVTREDGRASTYSLVNGVWVGDADVPDTLSEATDASGNLAGWTLWRADTRSTEQFNATGQLTSVQDQDGFITTLTYSTASTPSAVAPSAGLLIAITDPSQRSIQLTYNGSGWINQVEAPDGSIYAYAYDASGDLVTVTYPDSKVLTYLYNESAYSGGATTPALLTGVVDENNVRYTTYSYNASGQATADQLSGGVASYAITYNSDGSADVVDPLNTSRHRTFTTIIGVPHVTGLNGTCESCSPISAWIYDANGNPQQATDFNGNVTATTYDANGLLDQQIDASGTSSQRTTTTTWNTTLRVPLTRVVQDASGNTVSTTQWVYNASGQTLARCAIDPTNSAASGYTCSATGTVPAGVRRWTYTYCTAVDTVQCPLVGLLLTATGPRTDLTQTTTYSYYLTASAVNCDTPGAACYQPGDLHTITDALGHVTTIASYDADGRVTRETDANGVNTDMTYTPRDWLATRTVGGAQTAFTYTPYGAIQTVTDPDGVTTTYGYDAAHRLTKITDALGNYIQYTLDAAGNKTGEQVFDSSGTVHRSQSRTFNTLGQLTMVVDGLNQTVFSASASGSYDANGNLIQSSDALGIQRQQGYDALNRLVQTIDNYNGTDTATRNTTTQYTYDSLDRLTQVTDPSNLATSYSYDGLSDATGQVSPDTGTTARTYDAAGNLSSQTDARGVLTSYTYDALNRLTGITYPAEPALNVTYTYDQATPISGCPSSFNIGHRTGMTDASGTTAWCYTNQGDIREVRQVINGVTYLHGYAYSPGRRLTYLQYPSGFELKYGFDSGGRVATVGYLQQPGPYGSYTSNTLTPLITGVTYLPFGPASGYTYAQGGQSVTRTYDANYRLTDSVGSGLALHFLRDAKGRIQAEGNAAGATPANETYQYDPLDRLTTVLDANGNLEEGVTYDATGDRLSKTTPQGMQSYVYSPGTHQLIGVGGATRTVDAAGNTTALTDPNGTLVGLGYDNSNRLTTVTSGDATIASYQYNGEGQRVWRTITTPSVGQAATVYDPAGSGNLYGEYFAANYREYVYLNGVVVASATNAGESAPGINYLYADHLGTLRAVRSTAGTTIYTWPWQNNVFGEQSASVNSPFYLRYPGQYYDVETGLNYNVNRDYDSSTGRYIEFDPLGLRAGPNGYAYVGGNPISNIDPLGLESPKAACGGGPGTYAYSICGDPPPSSTNCGCARLPDYDQFQLDVYVFSISATYTKYGDIFLGGGWNRGYPKPTGVGVSIASGWLLKCNPTQSQLNAFLSGPSGGFSAYAGFGGGVSTNASGTAVTAGVGAGVSVGGSNNWYQGNYLQ